MTERERDCSVVVLSECVAAADLHELARRHWESTNNSGPSSSSSSLLSSSLSLSGMKWQRSPKQFISLNVEATQIRAPLIASCGQTVSARSPSVTLWSPGARHCVLHWSEGVISFIPLKIPRNGLAFETNVQLMTENINESCRDAFEMKASHCENSDSCDAAKPTAHPQIYHLLTLLSLTVCVCNWNCEIFLTSRRQQFMCPYLQTGTCSPIHKHTANIIYPTIYNFIL